MEKEPEKEAKRSEREVESQVGGFVKRGGWLSGGQSCPAQKDQFDGSCKEDFEFGNLETDYIREGRGSIVLGKEIYCDMLKERGDSEREVGLESDSLSWNPACSEFQLCDLGRVT